MKYEKLFTDDKAAFKVVFIAIKQASKKWTVPIRNWKSALNIFEIEYGIKKFTQNLIQAL